MVDINPILIGLIIIAGAGAIYAAWRKYQSFNDPFWNATYGVACEICKRKDAIVKRSGYRVCEDCAEMLP